MTVEQQNNRINNVSQLGLIQYTVLVLHFSDTLFRVIQGNFPFWLISLFFSLSNQAPSVRPLGRQLRQASVMQGTTASLGPGHPHQRMEGQQVTDVLEVITVPGAPQHHCPVP